MPRSAILLLATLAVGVVCVAAAAVVNEPHAADASFNVGSFVVVVGANPFSMQILNGTDNSIVWQQGSHGRLGVGEYHGINLPIYEGYSFRWTESITYYNSTNLVSAATVDSKVVLVVNTTRPNTFIYVNVSLATPVAGAEDVELLAFDISAPNMGPASDINDQIWTPMLGLGFMITPDEGFYGFGERFSFANQRGQQLGCWTEDGGWSFYTDLRLPSGIESTYVPMPWFMSTRGYGFLLDTTYRSWFDMGKTVPDEFGYLLEWNSVRMLLFAPPAVASLAAAASSVTVNPARALVAFSGMFGRSLIPPTWMFGPWNQFTNAFNDTGNPWVAANRFIEEDVPSSVNIYEIHFFPMGDQVNHTAELQQLTSNFTGIGLKSIAYYNSMIDVRYNPVFEYCEAQGYFVKWANRTVNNTYTFDYKGAGSDPFYCGLLDLTNPAAVAWYQQQMQQGIDLGFAGWMYDYGEYVDPGTVFSNGQLGNQMHNAYPLVYQKAAFDFFTGLDPHPNDDYAPDYMYFVRSGYTGTQAYQWNMWTGDPSCDWTPHAGLPAQITGMLTVSMSGVSFTGSDIGGFVWLWPPTEELWVRWTQVGAVSGNMHVEAGGTGFLNIPKTIIRDFPDGGRIWRQYAKFRTSIIPYLVSMAHTYRFEGMPLMRHHFLSFPMDAAAVSQAYQFMLGDCLLAAPVVVQGATTQPVYLPQGELWHDFASVVTYDESDGRHRIGYAPAAAGGQTVTVQAPLDTLPMFVKSGSIVPTWDPSVDTVSNATDPRVVDSHSRSHLVHLWVWPRLSDATEGSIVAASNKWDEVAVNMTANDAALSSFTMSIVDSASAPHTLIMQLAMGPWARNSSSAAIVADSRLVGRAAAWSDVVSVDPTAPDAWAWDNVLQTVWIRVTGAMNLDLKF